jgi:hypothetical protein
MIMDTNYSMKAEQEGDIFDNLSKMGFFNLDKLAEAVDDCDLYLFSIVNALQEIE